MSDDLSIFVRLATVLQVAAFVWYVAAGTLVAGMALGLEAGPPPAAPWQPPAVEHRLVVKDTPAPALAQRVAQPQHGDDDTRAR